MSTPTALRPTTAIVSTAVWVPGAVISILPLFMSVMMFDAPGSEENVWLKLMLAGFVLFPVLCGASVAASWAAWFFMRSWTPERVSSGRRLRLGLGLLPLLGLLLITFGAVMIQVRCGGSFSCRN